MTFLEYYAHQTALYMLKTLSDVFAFSVWLYSFGLSCLPFFGRFCLLYVVSMVFFVENSMYFEINADLVDNSYNGKISPKGQLTFPSLEFVQFGSFV